MGSTSSMQFPTSVLIFTVVGNDYILKTGVTKVVLIRTAMKCFYFEDS